MVRNNQGCQKQCQTLGQPVCAVSLLDNKYSFQKMTIDIRLKNYMSKNMPRQGIRPGSVVLEITKLLCHILGPLLLYYMLAKAKQSTALHQNFVPKNYLLDALYQRSSNKAGLAVSILAGERSIALLCKVR